jgi:uncharacterized protein
VARIIAWLLLISLAPGALASFDEAMALYQRKDYPSAFSEFRRLAEIGDHAAQFNLGVMYYQGQSVEADAVRAYAWMALANQAQDATWKKVRDQVYAALSAPDKALADAAKDDLFRRLSDEALAKELQPVLTSTDSDVQSARVKKCVAPTYPSRMQREGSQGFVDLVYAVGTDGTTRLHGIKTATDPAFALAALDAVKRWRYEPSHLKGRPIEEYGLRMQFVFKLEGAEADHATIVRLIDDLHAKANSGGAEEAYKYASALEALSPFTRIPQSAGNPNQWYWMAASRGNGAAQFSLGNNLLHGNACTPDSIKGVKWLQRSAEGGQPEAQYVLAVEMLSGGRLAQQRDAAIKWLQRAADADFAAAKLKLAWLYATSPDEQLRNPALALSYLKRVPEKFIDQLSLLEARAAVAAASGNFGDAVHLQQDAVDEANRYELPTDLPALRLKTYQEGKPWIEAPPVTEPESSKQSSRRPPTTPTISAS